MVPLLIFLIWQDAPTFEAASVKASGPRSIRMFKDEPGRISYTRATLNDLIVRAYALGDYDQISGPSWLGTEYYDVVATLPAGSGKLESRKMLQTLLTDRFGMVAHHAIKDFPVYELVVGKNGPKLKAASEVGKPKLTTVHEAGKGHMVAHEQTMAKLALALRGPSGRLVIDKTGTKGEFDFSMDFESNEDIFDAVQRDLGLKLVSAKAPFDIIVVDKADRVPTGN